MNLRSAFAAWMFGLALVAAACQPAATPTAAPPASQPGGESKATATPAPQLSGEIKIDGSSTVYPISEAVAEEFGKAYPNVKVVVGISGTGGGFKKFCAGETDISDASRPIKTTEMETCQKNGIEFIELPVAYDALSVVVNPQNDWVACITVAELKKIWEPEAQGKITRWNQVNPQWPDAPLTLFGPGTDSGTFDYFTEAIVGKEDASRGDYTASEDDNVLVQGVANDRYALGYFGLAYYLENQDKLKALAIDNGKGCVAPSEQTVRDGTYQPLSRPLFIYVNRKAADRPEVEAFVRFYLTRGPALAKQVGYIPLPETVYQLALQRFEARKVGTVFKGGPQVGVSIEDLLKAEQ
ncbi:Phosphate-binding protein PstS [Candidatus Thermoflexus japonica]|uniref:Phosphate-binding protein n=1 Tax=Candidatus Thermoflexus japonica TaxID=2035417 RepID=A0A2H5Y6K1_9CHLR|nr:Phosphate-binding protein PstS [Candidatus Thermoflexus japonica]